MIFIFFLHFIQPSVKSNKYKQKVSKKKINLSEDNTKWTDIEIKSLLDFWEENLEEWKRGKTKVYQKIVNENILPGRTFEQIKNKVEKLYEMYLQKKKKTNSTGEGSINWIWFSQMEEILSQSKAINPNYITDSLTINSISDNENNKENHEVDESKKKKRKINRIESLSEVIAAMEESRDRFYEKKLDLEEHKIQKKFKLEE